jgi:hemerythrin
MDRFKWSPLFETGIADIDGDHRALIALATAIGDGLARRDERFRATLQEFIDAAEKHFTKEEDILGRAGFPDLDAHKAYHASLLTRAKELRKICDAEGDAEQAASCYSGLVDFLIDDVVRGDTQFKSFLDHRGLTDRHRA